MSMFTERLRNDRNPFDNYDLREQAADKIEKLEAALREIAAMDPKAIRADDLGRAARIARTTLALETDK